MDMPVVRSSYELRVKSLSLRRRLRRVLEVQLRFHPYKNPTVTAGWFSDLLRAEFDYFPPPDDPERDPCGYLLTHVAEHMTGRCGVPYLRIDPVLGPLKFDGCWKGEFAWRGDQPLPFTIWPDFRDGLWSRMQRLALGPPLRQKTLELAQRVLGQLDSLNQLCLDGASCELLQVLNAEWHEGPPLSSSEFQARLSLTRLSFWDSGYIHVCYDQNGLFADHGVRVDLNDRLEIEGVGLEG